MSYPYRGASSPPPIHAPQPTHPHYEIPEPPGTPGSEGGYVRYSSPPPPSQQPQYLAQGHNSQPTYGRPSYGGQSPQQAYGGGNAGQYQSFSSGGSSGPVPHGNMQPPLTQVGGVPMMGAAGVPNLAAAWGVNDATAQMGMQFGRSAVAAGQDYVEKHINTWVPTKMLKHQFNVSNAYVLEKLRLVVFPWRHRPWSRKVRRSESGQHDGYFPPREDVNSPDLYIPSMAIVTYVLLAALHAGLQRRFNPELLGMTTSKALGVILFDFFVIWFGCYMLAISGQGQFIDIFAYSGYKFEGIVLTVLARLIGLKGIFYWAVFAYAFAANAFFMIRSLRHVVIPDPTQAPSNVSVANSQTPNHAQRIARRNFLLIIALSQVVYMWLLSV